MKCQEVREQFFDAPTPEVKAHLAACNECAQAWNSLQSTMALMDEWKAPEPTPFFETRFQARLVEAKREEATSHWFTRLNALLRKSAFGMPVWRPILASTLALSMAVGIGLMARKPGMENPSNIARQEIPAVKGTAVSDLQTLEKHQDTIANLDLLDDLSADDQSADQSDDEL